MGAASGFQSIYERHKSSTRGALFSAPGLLYLTSRGALPAAAFCAALAELKFGHPFWTALGAGTGIELFLRSTFFIRRTSAAEDLLKGPLDLLRWYEALLLTQAERGASRRRKHVLKKHLPNDPFPDLCSRARQNVGAISDQEQRTQITDHIRQLELKYDADTRVLAVKQAEYRLELGYVLLDYGESTLRTLVEP
ncbi:MAG: hypothetical protein M3167_00425 [Acidobacteriota bacterium]|nr:hypothetical protein [Acidobacteriota bacterium]